MITVFESHLPPEFLEAAAAQYNALATLGQAIDVPAAQQAAEPLRRAAERASGREFPGPWRGRLFAQPEGGIVKAATLIVFLTRHNRGAGALQLHTRRTPGIDNLIHPTVGLAVLIDAPGSEPAYAFYPPEPEQVVLWCGP